MLVLWQLFIAFARVGILGYGGGQLGFMPLCNLQDKKTGLANIFIVV
ncbi:MAG: hypothetical protein ACOY9Y_04275 [Bacillota bacterium]